MRWSKKTIRADEARLTPFGRWLRARVLTNFQSSGNVLKGDMACWSTPVVDAIPGAIFNATGAPP